MINLKDIMTIDSLTYGEPSKTDIKKMSNDVGVFEGFDIKQFKQNPQPKNSSSETLDELLKIQSIPRDEDLIVKADDILNYFKDYIEALGFEYPEKHVKKLLVTTKPIILKLKYHYNRPRPSDLAEYWNLELDNFYLKTMGTPSYPSGHSTQGILVALSLGKMFPKYAKQLLKLGKDISYSRLVSKAHYPSDSRFGEALGLELYRHMEKNNGR
jgi:hypothetical protein|tara:strand:- start:3264 stop:3902 length:639 start_codon:yes stop_codon:yes gene_type:complete